MMLTVIRGVGYNLYMRTAFTMLLFVICAPAQVRIDRTAQGWKIGNSKIVLELLATPAGPVKIASLRSLASGTEWAVTPAPAGPALAWISTPLPEPGFGFVSGAAQDLPNGAKELRLHSEHKTSHARLALHIRCYPDSAVLEYEARLENAGSATLPLMDRILPLVLTLAAPIDLYTAAEKDAHGFRSTGRISKNAESSNWVVLRHGQESMLVGGDLGAGVLDWRVALDPQAGGIDLRAGSGFPPKKNSPQRPAFELAPGDSVTTPITFLAVAAGDADDAGNEAFRYLKRHVFPKPLPNSPLAAYCIWFTVPRSEDYLLEELQFARRMGFDVFYHDASWYEGSSLVPGTNDWSSGLGSYRESPEKFPSGLKHLSEAVRKAGMKFGIWVDPGNVDSVRVASGEFPDAWLAKIDGAPLVSRHPSLAPMTQLCLGNPKVVAFVKQNLGRIIDQWNLEWIKWDPSGTVNNNCNRTDHGHARNNGAYSAWKGKLEVWSYLLEHYPQLSGFECDPSLRYARSNPAAKSVLPGGYITEFITGPMVSPYVWGSPYSAKAELGLKWYSASALDYDIRKHLVHGFVFGNIDGMLSQRLSVAPPGYLEAFQRNLLFFKRYRHLLTEDVYHPALRAGASWSAIQYIKEDGSESVAFVFRDGGSDATNRVKLRGLTERATYQVTSLNERPGRDRILTAAELAGDGLEVKVPDQWMAKGDGLPGKEYEDQLQYGSDVLILRRK